MNALSLPATLENIGEARLPAAYQAAQKAIAECERVDECKSWSDKAAALASYARQARDDSLRVMAVRIQARAERRCGQLLKQVPRGDESTRYGQDGTVPPVNRTQMAEQAGLSERQRKTALRLASIPEQDFNRQVESPAPPTVTCLAEQGTERRSLRAPQLAGYADACRALQAFAQFCELQEAAELPAW